MGLTGFNPQTVNDSIRRVISAYESLVDALGQDMQTKFVGGMSDKWACNEAIKFFGEAFKPSVENLLVSVDTVFASVVEAMNSAAKNWATLTLSEFSAVSFAARNFRIDISPIVENISGVRGIDYENASTVIAQLDVIKNQCGAALFSAKSAVDDCGFVGGLQAAQLQNSLDIIKGKIYDAINDISEASTKAMNQTVTNYGDLAGRVAEAFSVNE